MKYTEIDYMIVRYQRLAEHYKYKVNPKHGIRAIDSIMYNFYIGKADYWAGKLMDSNL